MRKAGQSAFRDTEKLQLLLEQWSACQGLWRESEFFIELKQKKRYRQFGARRWLTCGELIFKYGSVEVADQIISGKQHDETASKTQIRPHPDLHGVDTDEASSNRHIFVVSYFMAR